MARRLIDRLPWPVSGPDEDNRVVWLCERAEEHLLHAHAPEQGHDLRGPTYWCDPWYEQACPMCRGRGDEVRVACPHCGGRGVIEIALANLDPTCDVLVCHRDVSVAALN